jgi:hypothetical protein
MCARSWLSRKSEVLSFQFEAAPLGIDLRVQQFCCIPTVQNLRKA